jgi:hypothetical protein
MSLPAKKEALLCWSCDVQALFQRIYQEVIEGGPFAAGDYTAMP